MQNNPYQTRQPSIDGNPLIRTACALQIIKRDIAKLQNIAAQLQGTT